MIQTYFNLSLNGLNCDLDKDYGTATCHSSKLIWRGQLNSMEGNDHLGGESKNDLAKLLLNGYREYGIEYFQACRGQFILGLSLPHKVVAYRSDLCPYPIFYSKNAVANHLFSFFSEDKPILDLIYFNRFLLKRHRLYYGEKCTPFQGIFRLLPGQTVEITRSGFQLQQLRCDPSDLFYNENQTTEDVITPIREIFDRAVREQFSHTTSNPVVEISGGIDSALSAAITAKYASPRGYMISYPDNPTHEVSSNLAKKVAFHLGVPLEILTIYDLIPREVDRFFYRDEPDPFYWQDLMFTPTRNEIVGKGNTLVSGAGGDELFLANLIVILWLVRKQNWRSVRKILREISAARKLSYAHLNWQVFLLRLPKRIRIWLQENWPWQQNPFSAQDINPFDNEETYPKFYRFDAPLDLAKNEGSAEELVEFSHLDVGIPTYLEEKGEMRYFHPYFDHRLIRYIHEKTSWHLIHEWSYPYKWLLRKVQAPFVPAELLERKVDDFRFDGFMANFLKKNRPYNLGLVSEFDAFGSDLIDKTAFERQYEKAIFGTMDDAAFEILTFVSYVDWWKNFQEALKIFRQQERFPRNVDIENNVQLGQNSQKLEILPN